MVRRSARCTIVDREQADPRRAVLPDQIPQSASPKGDSARELADIDVTPRPIECQCHGERNERLLRHQRNCQPRREARQNLILVVERLEGEQSNSAGRIAPCIDPMVSDV
jgi:hypothetical protein